MFAVPKKQQRSLTVAFLLMFGRKMGVDGMTPPFLYILENTPITAALVRYEVPLMSRHRIDFKPKTPLNCKVSTITGIFGFVTFEDSLNRSTRGLKAL